LFLLWPLAKPVLPAFHAHTLRHFSTFEQQQQQQKRWLEVRLHLLSPIHIHTITYIYAMGNSFKEVGKALVFTFLFIAHLAFRNFSIFLFIRRNTHSKKITKKQHLNARFLENCFEFLRAQQQQQPNKPLCSASQ